MGEGSGNDYVRFSRSAGQRIAKAVIAVEGGGRDQGPITFNPALGAPGGKVFRVATFTGAWAKDSFKTVTLRGSTSTLSVENFLYSLPDDGTKKAEVARDGTAWVLVNVEHVTQNVIWNVTQSSTALTFERMQVWVPAKFTTSPLTIALAECVTGYTGT